MKTGSGKRVGIAGAGIMGRLLAWELLQRGHQPTLFDPDPPGQGRAASHTAAGMLAPYSELESAELFVHRLGLEGLRLWEELSRCLGDIGFRPWGSLVLAHPGDEADLERFRRLLRSRLGPGADGGRWLDRPALQAREPGLPASFAGALWLPGEASVDNQRALAALDRALQAGGAAWRIGAKVDELGPGWLRCAGKLHDFDWVADCRGLGARESWPQLRGVRGELLEVQAPELCLRHMLRLMHPRYRLYLVSRGSGRYLLGATQIESEDYSPLSVRSALELLSALYSLHPGFGEARLLSSRSNCRPALPDNLPAVRVEAGLLRVNGLFRHGFLLAPAIARELGRLLDEGDDFKASWWELFKTEPAVAAELRA